MRNLGGQKALLLGVVLPVALGTFFLSVAFFIAFDLGPLEQVEQTHAIISFSSNQKESLSDSILLVAQIEEEEEYLPQNHAPHMVIAEGSGTLPVFWEPDFNQVPVTEVHEGEEYPYVALSNGWCEFYFEDDMTAWIQSVYIETLE